MFPLGVTSFWLSMWLDSKEFFKLNGGLTWELIQGQREAIENVLIFSILLSLVFPLHMYLMASSFIQTKFSRVVHIRPYFAFL